MNPRTEFRTQSDSPLFSVVIVSWNTAELIRRCIDSVFLRNPGESLEVVVVDNASSDGSAEQIAAAYPQVRLFVNTDNLGFARACNQGIAAARGEIVVLLNSDTEMQSERPLQRVREVLAADKTIGMLGARLDLPDGRVQSLGRRFLTVRELIRTQILFLRPVPNPAAFNTALLDVDYVDGAFLAFHRAIIEQVGTLDESFFMYAEDMDWCMRAHQKGWRVVVVADIRILHRHAASSRQNFQPVLLHNVRNISRFNTRYFGRRQGRFAYDVLLAGMLLRVPLSILRGKGLARVYFSGFCSALGSRRRFLGERV